MKMFYRRRTWDVEVRKDHVIVEGRHVKVMHHKLLPSSKEVAKAAIQQYIKRWGRTYGKRYEAYLAKNRECSRRWRLRNKEHLKAYNQRPEIRAWRKEYHTSYMRRWRQKLREER